MSDVVTVALIGAAVGLAQELFRAVAYMVKRKQAKKDKGDNSENAIAEAVRFLLMDKIEYLGCKAILAGEITYTMRKRLHSMHRVYHCGLNGNGDLDDLMDSVDDLPLTKEG